MRKLVRPAGPSCLLNNAATWTAEFVAGRLANPKYKFSWRSDSCYGEIKTCLSHMSQNHCAFCDGRVGTESRETIEHFRPKSRYPELAYTWDNLFLCCDGCQSAKLEKFDAAAVKPDEPTYQFHHYFLANYRTGELEIAPTADETRRESARVSIELYDLNKEARKQARLRELAHFGRDPEPILDDYNYRYFLE